MCLKLSLRVNFNMRVLRKWHGDIEAKTPHETYTYVVKSCICGQHVSKDFCTPVINKVCSGSQEGEFGGRTLAHKNFSCCLLLLQDGIIMATVRDNCHYSNDLLQGGLEGRLLYFFIYGCSLAEACAVVMNSTLMQVDFWNFKYCSNTI